MTQAEEQENLVKRLDGGEVDLEKQEGKSNNIRLAALWRNTQEQESQGQSDYSTNFLAQCV